MRRTLAVAAVPDSLPLSQIQSQFPKSNLHSGESPPSSLPHPLPLRRRRPLSMQFVRGIVCGKASAYSNAIANFRGSSQIRILNFRFISNENDDSRDKFSWDSPDSWSTGLTKDHFDGEAVGHRVGPTIAASGSGGCSDSDNPPPEKDIYYEFNEENRRNQGFVDGWDAKLKETTVLLNQVREPGARGSYLKDSEKGEMYRLHKENPEVYTIEKLAQDFRIMRQRVHAILWLKEIEEEEEKKLGHPLDDFVETLLDTFPEFFVSHDKEFHVASLPYKPDFKVMPEGWDGTTRDPDEVHYEISKKEDDMLYEEFVQKMNFNKMKMKGEVKVHKYSRRRPSDGWNFTVEKMGSRGKRGGAGGWKFVSQPDGSTRPLNDTEKMYVKRETPRRRRRILP